MIIFYHEVVESTMVVYTETPQSEKKPQILTQKYKYDLSVFLSHSFAHISGHDHYNAHSSSPKEKILKGDLLYTPL